MALRLDRVSAGDGAPRLLELVAQLLDLRFELAPLQPLALLLLHLVLQLPLLLLPLLQLIRQPR